MIPMAPGFFKPQANANVWSEPFDTLPSLTESGEPDTGTPVIETSTMRFGAIPSGDASKHYWVATFDASPTVENFEMSFLLKVYNRQAVSLGWYSGCSIVYRSSQPPTNSTFPDLPTVGSHNWVQIDGRSQTVARVRLYHNATPVTSTAFVDFSAETFVPMRLVVSGQSHKLYINDVLSCNMTTTSSESSASQIFLGAYTLTMFSGACDNWIDNIVLTY